MCTLERHICPPLQCCKPWHAPRQVRMLGKMLESLQPDGQVMFGQLEVMHLPGFARRNTVFKDMVERDRRHVNVQIAQEGALGWWQRCRQPCAIALSVCVLVVLLSTPQAASGMEHEACVAERWDVLGMKLCAGGGVLPRMARLCGDGSGCAPVLVAWPVHSSAAVPSATW